MRRLNNELRKMENFKGATDLEWEGLRNRGSRRPDERWLSFFLMRLPKGVNSEPEGGRIVGAKSA